MMNEKNVRLLESLKMKNERLKQDIEFYKAKNPKFKSSEEVAKSIWMDGWAACETVKGLQDLKYSDKNGDEQ